MAGGRGGGERRVGHQQRADRQGGVHGGRGGVHADAGRDHPQRLGQRDGGGPLGRVLAQAALDDRPQRLGHGAGALRLLREVRLQDRHRVVALERRAAGDQFVQHDAGTVDVDRGGLRAAVGGLRGDVGGGADELVGAGDARGVGEPGDAEVGEHRVHPLAAVHGQGGQQHVGGLQVAVHDAVGVAGGQRVGDLRHQQRAGDRRQRAGLAQVAVQVGAVDQVHHQGEQLALDDQVAGAHDVGVGEAQQDGALAEETHHHVRVGGEFLAQDLHRDRLAGLQARHGGVLAHPAAPDRAGRSASEALLEQVLAADRPHLCTPFGHPAPAAGAAFRHSPVPVNGAGALGNRPRAGAPGFRQL